MWIWGSWNFYELGNDSISIATPHGTIQTGNAEAAFQALKHPLYYDQWSGLKGTEAGRHAQVMKNDRDIDYTYSGLGRIGGMYAVLFAKFSNPYCRQMLLSTGDALLIEHNEKQGRDNFWSNDGNGDGQNMLGWLLMQIRDTINESSSLQSSWSVYFHKTAPDDRQELIQATTVEILRALTSSSSTKSLRPQCIHPGCNKPTWNNAQNEFCSKSCRALALAGVTPLSASVTIQSPSKAFSCKLPGCIQPTWNGRDNEFCSRRCQRMAVAAMQT